MSGYFSRLLARAGAAPLAAPAESLAAAVPPAAPIETIEVEDAAPPARPQRGGEPESKAIEERAESADTSQRESRPHFAPIAGDARAAETEPSLRLDAPRAEDPLDVPPARLVADEKIASPPASEGDASERHVGGAPPEAPAVARMSSLAVHPEASAARLRPVFEVTSLETTASPKQATGEDRESEARPSRSAILDAVRSWVAAPPIEIEEEQVDRPVTWRSADATAAMASQLPLRPAAEGPARVAAESLPELTLSIGRLSVTIEEPAPAPVVTPPPRPPSRVTSAPSADHLRLRRHYLRG